MMIDDKGDDKTYGAAYNFYSTTLNHYLEVRIEVEDGQSIPSIVSFDGDYAESVGVVDIDRTKFGITYGSGTFFEGLADKAINDNFTLKFKIVAKKNDQ